MAVEIKPKTIIIGAGPAGLAAAYELTKHGHPCLVLEQSNKLGGIARTETYQGYYFDLGGHRFFSKSEEINLLWQEILPEKFLKRSRLSRIYYRKKFFNYPLKPFNALSGLGLWESLRILSSYLKQKLFPYPKEATFEEWVSNRFGQRLYEIFFKSYTEKVWGIPCREINAEWAAQRIKGLSLTSAVINAFLGARKGKKIKTLIEEFWYPQTGPGLMWEEMAKKIKALGGEIRFNSQATKLIIEKNQVTACEVNGQERISADQFIASLPLRDLVIAANGPLNAANSLQYRDFLTVALIIDQAELFPDNWIYIHSPEVLLGRIQNFKNWSPFMVPEQTKTCLGLEYFCNYGDKLWTAPDQQLIELGSSELKMVGLLPTKSKIIGGTVLRVKNAYPVYNGNYAEAVKIIREFLDQVPNLQPVGRAGMHRYNNMDHSMLTGLYAARNIIAGKKIANLWEVNADQEYHETHSSPPASSNQ